MSRVPLATSRFFLARLKIFSSILAIIDTDTTHTSTYGTQIKGSDVELDYVVGFITDRDGLLSDFQLERAETTPLEARKGYRNTWLHIAKNGICDPTENCILYYMADSVSPEPTPTGTKMTKNAKVDFQNN